MAGAVVSASGAGSPTLEPVTSPQDGPYPGPYAHRDPRAGGPPSPPPQGGYNPYGAQRPPRERSAPFTPTPAARPGRPPQLLLAVGLLALGALPWLALGVALAALPLNVQGVIDSGTVAGSPLAGYTAEDLAALVRAAAAVSVVCSLVHLLLVGFTYGGRRWARVLVTVLTALFAAGLVVVLITTVSPIVALLIAVPVAGAVLLFTRPVSAWFAG